MKFFLDFVEPMYNTACMPHLYKKKVQGRTYWYLRETAREGRKVRVKWQKYLGTPETLLAKLEKAEADKMPLKIRSEEFGSIFMANELEKVIDTIGIVDSIVPGNKRETGPSVGEYFFYAWVNRLIEPKSKNMIGTWFSRTAIDTLRRVNTHELSSKRYWDKWDRVSREQVEEIGKAFFERVWKVRKRAPECVLVRHHELLQLHGIRNGIRTLRARLQQGRETPSQAGWPGFACRYRQPSAVVLSGVFR